MQPEKYYENRLVALKNQLSIYQKRKSTLAWLRFGALGGAISTFLLLLPYGWEYAAMACLLLIAAFIRLVFFDLKNKTAIENTIQLIEINQDELKALAHDYFHFDEGNEYLPKEHLYAFDLDIFGRASLFQYANRTTSQLGGATFAKWLLNPAEATIILQRQTAVKELSAKTEWRQQLMAFGKQKKVLATTQHRLEKWLHEPNRFINKKYWQRLQFVFPVCMLSILGFNFFDIISDPARNTALLISGVIAFFISRKVGPMHSQLAKMSAELDVLSDSIELIEQVIFKTELLKNLQQQYYQRQSTASAELYKLKTILERLDMRFNMVVFPVLAILFQWDLLQAIALEKWKQRNQQNCIDWMEALANFEALNSLSTLAFNHPKWCLPILKEEQFFIEGSEIGHLLIPENKRVNNKICIKAKGQLMLVTGSNMAGKSTYLRSIGTNVVLAMAGSFVCAKSFSLSFVQLITSMRIADNLEENTSTFYAELKKLKIVIEKVNRQEKVFILLDEILRGTNSLDRHTGSAALIKQLIKHEAAAIVATHDIELTKLKENYPSNIFNYHFDVQVSSNDELYFDYQLKEGVCNSLNASILMKKIGIEM